MTGLIKHKLSRFRFESRTYSKNEVKSIREEIGILPRK